MHIEWQTLIAVGIVLVTLAIFVIRLLKPKPKGGCGHDCGCGKQPDPIKAHRHD